MEALPFSQSCENNKAAIAAVLKEAFADRSAVLEIASGTGQHATCFAAELPWLQWRPTELPGQLQVLRPRCDHYSGDNLAAPVALDVREQPFAVEIPDAIFTANSFHIMAFAAVKAFFNALANAADGTRLAVYGPFNYGGRYTSPSNARFDVWLGEHYPEGAIRDFEAVDELATMAGFRLLEDRAMPANNRLLQWSRSG